MSSCGYDTAGDAVRSGTDEISKLMALFFRWEDVQRCDSTDLDVVYAVCSVGRWMAEKLLQRRKILLSLLYTFHSDLAGKHLSLLFLIGECDRMQAY